MLRFPAEYPFRPPSIYMITPNGRFKPNTRLCLSISDFHPDTWNPSWSVSTILTGLLSFMVSRSLGEADQRTAVEVENVRTTVVLMIDCASITVHVGNMYAMSS